ncbi:ly6/PLAUR domain-containing protein 2-like [Lithobates pipiens]
MAAQASALLLAAFCIGTADSLQCYTCTVATRNSNNNNNCKTTTACPFLYNYCQTSLVKSLFGTTAMTKSCSFSCMESNVNSIGGSTSVSCCSSDLCNGGISIRSSYSTIFLVMGTVVMLFSHTLL